ncbi:peptide deformylase [Bradyrhizobium prioriisuperbiae]|uniref:peptide deformylase n=1 Tax=Bradyrhizobium prioriisuperbiae TaxID=2854389 RepID=UPI0028E2EA4C|nr:peptide deformylase [Bradyrhizobium prioritasuperba]
MYAAAGIGLAAIRIGEPWRVVTIDLGGQNEPRQPRVFINPEVMWHSEEAAIYMEGCLSIPTSYEEVERPASVRVRYLDINGAQRKIEAGGLLATCLQHEIEHLDGKLFIDRLSRLRRDRVIKRLAKTRRHSAGPMA